MICYRRLSTRKRADTFTVSCQTHDDPNVKQVSQVVVNRQVQDEMEKRYAHLVSRLTSLKTESEETWKTIETAEKTLMEMINQRDYDCAHYFIDEPRADNKQPESMLIKMKADRQETEDFYLGVCAGDFFKLNL